MPLPDGGRAVAKSESQKVSEICDAERSWVEIEGIPQATAASKINNLIRRKISVGRKLKASDCPNPEDGETYRYFNRVEVSGVWRRYLGTITTICFPGGTGRCVVSCELFDLQTGQRGDLKKYINPAERADLGKLLNKQAEADEFPAGYLPIDPKEAAVCLEKDGIRVRFTNDSGSATTSIAIGIPEISRYFRLPPEVASDLPHK
jgi:hypothetical protein